MTALSLPNFIIIGAARCGTSSLYEYMQQHPQIYFSPNKEPMYFAFAGTNVNFQGPGDDLEINRKAVTGLESYKKLFQGAGTASAVGEASANYLYDRAAPANIYQHVPHARLIVVLRNPVERAYSSYLYTIRDGREPLTTFEAALEAEPERIARHWEHIWHYASMGLYAEQLQRYLTLFPREQIKIIFQDDLKHHTADVLRDVFAFLGVDTAFTPDFSVEYNQGGKPKSELLNRILTKPSLLKTWVRPLLPRKMVDAYIRLKHQNLAKPELLPETRRRLIAFYRDDVMKLQALLGKDLQHWLAE